MSLIPQTYDLSAANSGPFDPQLSRASGAVLLVNFSAFDLRITPPDNNQYTVPANCIRCKHYIGGYASGQWSWAKLQTAPVVSTPSSLIVESYSEGVEPIPPEYIIPLTRGATVGAAVGINGSAVILAESLRTTVLVTTPVTILTFSIPANGTYRLNGSVRIGNTTASNKPRFQATFTGPTGAADSLYFSGPDASSPTAVYHILDGSTAVFGASWGNVGPAPLVADMNAGTLTVVYQTNGTPSDTVTVVVEQIA